MGKESPKGHRPNEYRPGFVRRGHRLHRGFARLKRQVRKQHPGLPRSEVIAEAIRRRLEADLPEDPVLLRYYRSTEPTSLAPPEAREQHELIEVAAIRRQPEVAHIRQTLTQPRLGRPVDRALSMSCLEALWFGRGKKQFKTIYHSFRSNFPLLAWAFDHPLSREGSGVQELKAAYRTAGAMLERHHPRLLLQANISGLKRLMQLGHPDIGRYLMLDGQLVEGDFEQRPGDGKEEERLLRRGTTATFGTHGATKACRGWLVMMLADLKSTLPVVWMLFPANTSEQVAVYPLLRLLYELWPDCPAEYLVTDRGFDSKKLARVLERDYGIHPVIRLKGSIGRKVLHGSTRGVPHCAKHGFMKRVQAEDFTGPAKRRVLGLQPGDPAPGFVNARIRWQCRKCPARATTYPKVNARVYTYLPHDGDHPLAGLRRVLQHRRNSIEAVFANVEECGFALTGQAHCRWARTDQRIEWTMGAAFLAQTMRRVAHADGTYAEVVAEARRLKHVF